MHNESQRQCNGQNLRVLELILMELQFGEIERCNL